MMLFSRVLRVAQSADDVDDYCRHRDDGGDHDDDDCDDECDLTAIIRNISRINMAYQSNGLHHYNTHIFLCFLRLHSQFSPYKIIIIILSSLGRVCYDLVGKRNLPHPLSLSIYRPRSCSITRLTFAIKITIVHSLSLSL